MTKLSILRYPDPRLHKVAKPVVVVDDRIRQLVAAMFEAMYEAKGVGLAATQVDVHEQVVVIDVSEARNAPRVLINPKLLSVSQEVEVHNEGCLSVPTVYEDVTRPAQIVVQALNLQGESYQFEATGLLAICVQHEIDHLQGKVFVAHLSALKRGRIRTKLVKQYRDEQQHPPLQPQP
jgi:peptide deformylase